MRFFQKSKKKKNQRNEELTTTTTMPVITESEAQAVPEKKSSDDSFMLVMEDMPSPVVMSTTTTSATKDQTGSPQDPPESTLTTESTATATAAPILANTTTNTSNTPTIENTHNNLTTPVQQNVSQVKKQDSWEKVEETETKNVNTQSENIPKNNSKISTASTPNASAPYWATPSDTMNSGKASSYDIESTDSTSFALMRDGPMPSPDSFLAAHLVQWKYAAEEGYMIIKVPAFLGGLALIATSIAPIVMYVQIHIPKTILAAHVFVQAIVICHLEGRCCMAGNPLGFRAQVRNLFIRHFNVLRLVWGRGLLYFSAGLICMAQDYLITWCAGGFMVFMGIVAMIVGGLASANLDRLKSSLTDDQFMWAEFDRFDGDKDGFLRPYDFSALLWSLGVELDDMQTVKAFATIDTDKDKKISYQEFRLWWFQSKALKRSARGRTKVGGILIEDGDYVQLT